MKPATLLLALLFYVLAGYSQPVFPWKEKAVPVTKVVTEIERRYSFPTAWGAGTLDGIPPLDVDLPAGTGVKSAFKLIFAGLRIEAIVDSGTALLKRLPGRLFQQLTLVIANDRGDTLGDASVFLPFEKRYVQHDHAGVFRYDVDAFLTTIQISYSGYQPKTITLSNKVPMNRIILEPSVEGLDQVEITAYGQSTSRLNTGSISTVKGDDLRSKSSFDLGQCLNGASPGLWQRTLSGVDGSSFDLRIRGPNSIQQGNYPLIVINDIPLADNGSILTTIGSGSAQRPYGSGILNCISPDIIKSVSVLRGPDATALYGSRATNGVILFTLKEGTSGDLRVAAGLEAGGSRAVKIPRLLNTSQFLQLRKEATDNDGFIPDSGNLYEQNAFGSVRNINYSKYVMGATGQEFHAHVDLSWSAKHSYFYASGSTLELSSVFPGKTADDCQSLFGAWQYHSENGRLQVSGSGLYSYEHNRLPVEDFSHFQGLAPNAAPFWDLQGQPQWSYNSLQYQNIPALGNNVYQSGISNLFFHFHLQWTTPWKVMSLETRLGYNSIAADETSMRPLSGQYPDPASPPTGETDLAQNKYNGELVEQLIRFNQQVGPGKLAAFAGGTWQAQNTGQQATDLGGYTSDALMRLGAQAPQTSIDHSHQDYRYDALLGQVKYTISDKYILSGSWRRDGSSHFAPAQRYGDFWSVSGGWIFTADTAIKKRLPWLSFGKIRAGYGTTGNDELGAKGYTQVFYPVIAARVYQGSSGQGTAPDSLYNPYIHWEESHEAEAAIELGFLNDRLLFSATGYYSRSCNQLISIQLASQAGRPGILANEPVVVVSDGLELQAQVNLGSAHFHWSSTLNLTLPRNHLANYPGLATSPYASILTVGRPIDAAKAYHFTGIDTQTGIYRFQGQDSSGNLTPKNLVASPAPDQRCFAGWRNRFSYKKFGVEIFLQFVAQDGVNPFGTLYAQNPPGIEDPLQLSNGPVEWANHWRNPGDRAKLQKVSSFPSSPTNTASYNFTQSDANIIDASYLRLSNFLISYQLPGKWLNRKGTGTAEIYGRGENLLTFTKYPITDPETQFAPGLPPMRRIAIGIKTSF